MVLKPSLDLNLNALEEHQPLRSLTLDESFRLTATVLFDFLLVCPGLRSLKCITPKGRVLPREDESVDKYQYSPMRLRNATEALSPVYDCLERLEFLAGNDRIVHDDPTHLSHFKVLKHLTVPLCLVFIEGQDAPTLPKTLQSLAIVSEDGSAPSEIQLEFGET
ncbi:MAG: hypothetical protein Q9227_004828 [Pyrenula ochraceoflavens]